MNWGEPRRKSWRVGGRKRSLIWKALTRKGQEVWMAFQYCFGKTEATVQWRTSGICGRSCRLLSTGWSPSPSSGDGRKARSLLLPTCGCSNSKLWLIPQSIPYWFLCVCGTVILRQLPAWRSGCPVFFFCVQRNPNIPKVQFAYLCPRQPRSLSASGIQTVGREMERIPMSRFT